MLVPALVHLAGISVHVAIPAAMMSYIVTGLAGTFLYARARSVKWNMAGWLSAGAIPGAMAGAFTANLAPGVLIESLIGLFAALSGLHTLFSRRARHCSEGRPVSNRALCFLGIITGFASALTGTAGPLVLVPLLMALDFAVLTAVGLSQAIQLPVALVATGVNFHSGSLDLKLGGLLALGVPVGVWAGSKSP